MLTVGIDTGGTFTDLVEVRGDGSIAVHKVPSTPHDYAQGVLDATSLVSTDDAVARSPADIHSFTLGTTIATNAFLTRTGVTVGFLTTAGHGDTLEIMRVFGRAAGLDSTALQSYALTDKPPPVVPRSLVAEITERIDCEGAVVVALDESAAVEAMRNLVEQGAEALAVTFLWSFLNPAHERRVRDLAAKNFPGLDVILSSDVVPKLGEYERAITTVVDAYVAPVLKRYLDRIRNGLDACHVTVPLLVMHSTGGVGTQEYTRDHAVTTLFSGPAGGVIGARHVGERLGHANIICTDMGGTSFDVGLVIDGRPLLRSHTIVDQHVMALPSIDIVSIGAGGGSILNVVDGLVEIGPQSAGADPGPACYGRGSTRATLTDVDVLLGYIDPQRFVGGEIKLQPELARSAVAEHLAEPLGMEVGSAAAAAFAIANARMADLIRKVTVERGIDPREFCLYAYGGLGPLHAPFYGMDLGVDSIVIPLGQISSVFSAYGIAVSDLLHVYETSKLLAAPFDAMQVNAFFAALEKTATAQLEKDRVRAEDREFHRFLEMRYKGQFSEIVVPVRRGHLGPEMVQRLSDDFEQRYLSTFGAGSLWSEGTLEIVAFRVEAIGRRAAPTARGQARERTTRSQAAPRMRDVYWPSEQHYVPTQVLSGSTLVAETTVSGPAVLDLTTTTLLIPPGWRCVVDLTGSLLMTCEVPGGKTVARGNNA